MATLPPILVELKANSSELTSKLGEIQGQFQKTSSEAQSMGDKIKAHFGAISTAVGGALAGAGGALAALGSKDQAAQQQLQASIEATGKSYDDYKERVEKTVTANEKFGDTADQSKDAIRILTQATGDAGAAMDQMQLVTNLAAAKHESLSAAATQVAKAHGGAAKLFKEFGVTVGTNITGAKDYDEALAVLSEKLSGQAAAASDTFTGKIAGIKAHVEDVAASLGSKFGPALTVGGTALTGLAGGLQVASSIMDHFKTTQEAATVATEGLTGAEEAGTVAEGLALGPILLIVGAVAAVGVAIYELWTHWSTIWGWIQDAISGVWNWIKTNWPLLLGILLGPIGLVVAGLIKNWTAIKDGFTDVWNAIKGGVTDAKNWVSDRVGDIVNFLISIPKKIAGLGSAIFHEIVSNIPGSGIVAGVADKIGGLLHFAGGGMPPVGVPSVVGENGPEIFVPGVAGTIIPNGAALAGGGGVAVGTINVYAAPGQDAQAIARAVQSQLLQAGRGQVRVGLG